MQLTRAADYAVRVMVHLAGLPPSARVSRGDLSVAADCPEQFLAKVLQNLTRAGLVMSHRGNTGGFELDETHRSASVLEVIEAIEGPIRLNICLSSDHACSRQSWCPAHTVWGDAQEAHDRRTARRLASTCWPSARHVARQPAAGILIEEQLWN